MMPPLASVFKKTIPCISSLGISTLVSNRATSNLPNPNSRSPVLPSDSLKLLGHLHTLILVHCPVPCRLVLRVPLRGSRKRSEST